MKYFKDNENKLHAIENGFEYLLPEGLIEITEIEYSVLANPPETNEQVMARLQGELDAIERNALMPRGAREAFILLCLQQAQAAELTEAQAYQANPFYRGLKDTDDICAGLRAQIRALK